MKTTNRLLIILFAFLVFQNAFSQTTSSLPISEQTDYLKLYKFVLDASANHYQSSSSTINTSMFASYGEFSVYLSDGDFVFADTVPQKYSTLKVNKLSSYDYTSKTHLSVSFDKKPKKIAVFQSKQGTGNEAISWQAFAFRTMFDAILPEKSYCMINEDSINQNGISDSTELLIFPAVKINGQDYGFFVNQIVAGIPNFTQKINDFLQRGGKIYTEGNGILFLEKCGILASGSVDYSNGIAHDGSNYYEIENTPNIHPSQMATSIASGKLYSSLIPQVNATNITSFVSLITPSAPVIFSISNTNATYENQIVANLGLTTSITEGNERAQSLFTLQNILGFFTSSLDVTRNVRNTLTPGIIAGDNAIAFDVVDTFSVAIVIRNLSDIALNSITINEKINPYFSIGTASGSTITGNSISYTIASLAAYEEKTFTYTLITASPDSEKHEKIDDYLAKDSYISVSENSSTYVSANGKVENTKSMAYADILFSANIVADADVNWKNFLGLEYQPFKVFLNMENKGRTQANEVVYTQYIPKDVPYYQTDNSINIPILKTPGGKFVTVMKGSNDEANPDFDFDSDGKPDAWLDTSSIYPKGYILEEEEVYWSNPWSYLRTGNVNEYVFEDIDHDGQVALDTDGDGIVDVEEPGDKIRVWKITWNINTVKGYEYFEPYCYYELWLDPPKLVELAAGVGYANDSLTESFNGMFYPYTSNIANANLADTAWANWMEHDAAGNVIWKEMVLQSANNYEGYTFVDTASVNFRLQPTDKVIGRTPQPHNEFIAVVSLGGEEIDMTHWTPRKSLYSNVDYTTIFNEQKTTPIRTTYTYYAPLPNPLQFEYMTDCYTIYDTLGTQIEKLPHRGKAVIQFDIDASTEYSYYWIRGVGHDVDYNDPSEATEGAAFEGLGDGVFGYFVYEIPKGMGGYTIDLPRKDDGSFDIAQIVQVNGGSFEKWLDNPNTKNEVEIWDGPMSYQIYIPQVLLPPAIDDDNFDGIDDWIDDKGDRFSSKTGYLHDVFMDGNGEDWQNYPTETHWDNLAGNVDSGWYYGADQTYGDDIFEALGITHFTIKANYEGKGREGNLEISRGGTLVVEEIFGGSPWVVFSHVQTSQAQGLDLSIESEINPSVVKIGNDTVYLKHTIKDSNEPHKFDLQFDPYHRSLGYTDANFTTLVGAQDPCNLISPVIDMPSLIDPSKDQKTITLIPAADAQTNPELTGYPKTVTGAFVEIRVEASNGSDDNWKNVKIEADLSALGASEIVMQYVAYPRPLVPDDNFGSFSTGWRFNQPEGEVVVQMGNEIPMIQPTRRAYFVYLIKVTGLAKGIYEVPFTVSGQKVYYNGTANGSLQYSVPSGKICIVQKDANGKVVDFQKIILEQAALKNLEIDPGKYYTSLGEAKWSAADVDASDYATLTNSLTVSKKDGMEVLDLSSVGSFPQTSLSEFYILQPLAINSYDAEDIDLQITNGQDLNFTTSGRDSLISSKALSVTPLGPKVKVSHILYSINGKPVSEGIEYESDKPIYAVTKLVAKNDGADISRQTIIKVQTGSYFEIVIDSLPAGATVNGGMVYVNFGDLIQGEQKEVFLHFKLSVAIPKTVDITTLINKTDITYTGTAIAADFNFSNSEDIIASLYDFEIKDIIYVFPTPTTVSITATAYNKGIDAENVWFRVYPVIGQGAYEFAVEEQEIPTFAAGEEVEITFTYSLQNIGKSLEMLARIDDQDEYIETTEKNNIEKTDFIQTDLSDINNGENSLMVGPNPCSDKVNFTYFMKEEQKDISITLYTVNGNVVRERKACPAAAGTTTVSFTNLNLASGNYLYVIKSGNQELWSGSIVVE